jgi:hypothetical protein
MVCRGHTKETVGLLNVNSMHLNTLFDGRSWSYQRNRGVAHDIPSKRVFKCIEFTFNNPTFLCMTSTYHRRGCINIYSLHLTTPRFHWYDHDIPSKRVFQCIEFTFKSPTVSLVWPRPTVEEGAYIYTSSSMVGRGHTKKRGVVKRKLYTFKHPLRWYVMVIPIKRRVVKCKLYIFKHPPPRFLWYDHDLPSKRVLKCIEFAFNNPTVSLISPRSTIEEGV